MGPGFSAQMTWWFSSSPQPTDGTERGAALGLCAQNNLLGVAHGTPSPQEEDAAQKGCVFTTLALTGPSLRAGCLSLSKGCFMGSRSRPEPGHARWVWASIPSAPGPQSLALGRAWPGGDSGPAPRAEQRQSRAMGRGSRTSGPWLGGGGVQASPPALEQHREVIPNSSLTLTIPGQVLVQICLSVPLLNK